MFQSAKRILLQEGLCLGKNRSLSLNESHHLWHRCDGDKPDTLSKIVSILGITTLGILYVAICQHNIFLNTMRMQLLD